MKVEVVDNRVNCAGFTADYQMPSPIKVMLKASQPKRPIAIRVSNVNEASVFCSVVRSACRFMELLPYGIKCKGLNSHHFIKAKTVPLLPEGVSRTAL